METHTVILFRDCYSKGVSHCHLTFGKDTKSGRGVGKLHNEEREGFRYALPDWIEILALIPISVTNIKQAGFLGWLL